MGSDKRLKQMEATVRLYARLLDEALDYERQAWDADEDIEGGDFVEWFGGWRERVKAELIAVTERQMKEVDERCAKLDAEGGSIS